jgi:predicted ATP-dependent endonuclease of OLD family
MRHMALRIDRLEVTKLHGLFDRQISFKQGVNLLVGINGSGKTSVLNMVDWLLKPSLNHLCVTQFRRAKLFFVVDGIKHIITCTQAKDKLTYELQGPAKFHSLEVTLSASAERANRDASLRESLLAQYSGLTPTREEKATWDYLHDKLPKPVIIGLDRQLFASEGKHAVFEERAIGRVLQGQTMQQSPLDRVREFANTRYRQHRNNVINLNDRLKSKIMFSAFSTSLSMKNLSKTKFAEITIKDIGRLELKVKDYFAAISRQTKDKKAVVSPEQLRIARYFRSLKQVLLKQSSSRANPETRLLMMMNYSQFEKLRELIKEFEQFEVDSTKSYSDIKEYLDTLNGFFKDSSKELVYRDDTTELTYNQLDQSGHSIAKFLDLTTLSSGERQIVILLTYLRFGNQVSQLFLIDEPELSLHPKWQAQFLAAVKILTPKDTQLILATHSPEIVGEQDSSCTVLLPYNTKAR